MNMLLFISSLYYYYFPIDLIMYIFICHRDPNGEYQDVEAIARQA